MKTSSHLLLAAASVALSATGASAQQPISTANSFRIGSGGQTLCTAQLRAFDELTKSMFDRAYAVVCRDASAPVGRLYVLDARQGDPLARLVDRRQKDVTCAPDQALDLENLGMVETLACTLNEYGLSYRVYLWRSGNKLHIAEGLSAYDSALRLGLRSLALNRVVDGEVQIATTQVGDPAAFARIQAGNLDKPAARLEAYRRATGGNYAEAVEFFRTSAGDENGGGRVEALLNEALQQSNLGLAETAERQFLQARQEIGNDPVLHRMLRNYEVIHLLNRQRIDDAISVLNRPLPAGTAMIEGDLARRLVIDEATAKRLSAEDPAFRRLGVASADLLPSERAEILDAQAQHLRGTMLRLKGRDAEAGPALQQAIATLDRVRSGRVTSTVWMRAQVLGELAELAEGAGDQTRAGKMHAEAIGVLQANYPGSPTWLNAQARYAAYQARHGRENESLALFERVVAETRATGSISPALKRTLEPYLKMLVRRSTQDRNAIAKLFVASQILIRPGVAQTQAVLARELSGGSDEASRLFRQSVNLTRDIERLRVSIARLSGTGSGAGDNGPQVEALRRQLSDVERAQTATQAQLTQFPRYRVVTDPVVDLGQLQEVLRDGEIYYKLVTLDSESLAIVVTADSARAFPVDISARALEKQVTEIRDTITFIRNGEVVTDAFNIASSHKLYQTLFGPMNAELQKARHLVFEPDGAMLRLPPNLLVTDGASVNAYQVRTANPNADLFDFTNVAWLGRDRDISTAVSVNGFRQVRLAPPSKAVNSYVGFGQNTPVGDVSKLAPAVRASIAVGDECGWSLAQWSRPISPDELRLASQILEKRGAKNTAVVIGEEFTDTAIQKMRQLDEYRILHFATHGLVTAPRPGCPARPALLTSFGTGNSDGLLTFAEIFDLKIDADLVILSACDTAGEASAAVTREAGVTTGGGSALDGLVRAFVAAGGRTVVASHWPVPDSFDATKRLISGMFTSPAGAPVASSLRQSQRQLMNDPATSHPFYWAAFAVVGDGASPMIREVKALAKHSENTQASN